MRERWYGDKRDVVKWGALAWLAQECRISHVIHVPFLGPAETPLELEIRGKYPRASARTGSVNTQVWGHFRSMDDIQRLAASLSLRIEVVHEPWTGPRGHYIDAVSSLIRKTPRPVVVLVDPDTGITDDGAGGRKHIRVTELNSIVRAMRKRDGLVLYQHAGRSQGWLSKSEARFRKAIGAGHRRVITVTAPAWASDVALPVALPCRARREDQRQFGRPDSLDAP